MPHRGWIQREAWGIGPYDGVDYNLTVSQSRLRSPALHPNDEECQRMSTNCSKMEQLIGKGDYAYEEDGGKGFRKTVLGSFYSYIWQFALSYRRLSNSEKENSHTLTKCTWVSLFFLRQSYWLTASFPNSFRWFILRNQFFNMKQLFTHKSAVFSQVWKHDLWKVIFTITTFNLKSGTVEFFFLKTLTWIVNCSPRRTQTSSFYIFKTFWIF